MPQLPATNGPPQKLRDTANRLRRPLIAAIGFWTILAAIFASQHAVMVWSKGQDVCLTTILKHQVLGLGPWLLMTPPVFLFAARMSAAGATRLRTFQLHAVAAAVCVLVHAIVAIAAAQVIMPELITEPIVEHFWKYLGESYGFSIILYVVVTFLFYLIQHTTALSERDVERAELRERLAKAQLEALQVQLQPHFLFNTLNSISAMIHENPEGADQMIDQLSEFLRIVLENARGEPITLGEELRVLDVYLAIQQTRFHSRLRFDIVAPEDVQNCMVPALLLQPLVENALKYGLTAQGDGSVRIRVHRAADWLEIQVADDGAAGGAMQGKGMGVGLANTRARLRHFYGDLFELSLQRRATGGAVVTIRIPSRPSQTGARTLRSA